MVEEGRSRLGRGLAALIGDVGGGALEPSSQRPVRAPIEFLRPNPRNPRQAFPEDELRELADSIRERGIVQPIVVREIKGLNNVYEIIAGERRWRAAQLVGLHEAPIVVVEADDRQSLEIAIVENVQRTDLNAMDEARGYQQLLDEFSYSHQEIAKVIGKSRSHVANTLRLLKLPDNAKKLVVDGLITAGHARALLATTDPEKIAQRIVDDGLTVRDVERLGQAVTAGDERKERTVREKDADTRALEKLLGDLLGLSVKINHRNDSGDIRIHYQSMDQLDLLCKRLQG
jgi:ParB family chromosome partitioning protein